MADILGGAEYEVITGVPAATYVAATTKPALYDPAINAATSDYQRDKKTALRNEEIRWWYVRRGCHRGLNENIMDALDKEYYDELDDDLTGYKKVKPIDFLNHLKNEWVEIDTGAVKKMKASFYEEWDPEENIKKFATRLTKKQESLDRDGIIISDADKLQFYIEQMYDAHRFDKKEMIAWETRPKLEKTWANAKKYFEKLVKIENSYNKMAGRQSTKRSRYESANAAAEEGDEVREYLGNIASAAAKQEEKALKQEENLNKMQATTEDLAKQISAKDNQISDLIKQVAELTRAVTNMATNNNNNNRGRSNSRDEEKTRNRSPDPRNKNNNNRNKITDLRRNMHCYCWSHGHDPVGVNHNSRTCNRTKKGHKKEATMEDRMGRSTYQAKKEDYHVEDRMKYTKRSK